MPISVGEKLGPYEIVAPIGVDDMGEVWEARDTRLNRLLADRDIFEAICTESEKDRDHLKGDGVQSLLANPRARAESGPDQRALRWDHWM